VNRLPERLGDLLPRVVAGFSVPSEPAKDTDMDKHPASIREHELPWPADVDPARWLLGATSSGEPHRRAVVATWKEIERLRAVEAAAAKYVHAGLCGNHSLPGMAGWAEHSADYHALVAAVRTNPDFNG
jgi:hypothetical protein